MKNKEEDYLDTLLNIVSDEKEEDSSNGKSSERQRTPENEFLKEFEEELNSDEDSDYLHEFEMELQADERRKAKPRYTEPEPEEEPEQPEPEPESEVEEEAPAALESDTDAPDADTQNLIDGLKARMEKIPDTKNSGEEPDLAGNGSADILDILAGDGKLSDIKDMLSDDGTGSADSGSSAIDDFAQKEMAASPVNEEKQENSEPDEKKDKKERGQKKKEKKPKGEKKEGGLFAKLAHILFHEADEDVESVTIKEPEQVDVKELSAENQQILRELEESEKASSKKKKEKKEKKPKPKKEKKPKPKKEKKPKPKKEKKPKEPDLTPPLPKVPVILIWVMAISLMVLVLAGTNLTSYQNHISEAKQLYLEGNYAQAYAQMDGLSLHSADKDLYDQLEILSTVSSKYDAYQSFQQYEKYDMALDSLICAEGRYHVNYSKAEDANCAEEMNQMESLIQTALQEKYQMSTDEAVQLYSLRDRDEYTREVQSKIKALGLE